MESFGKPVRRLLESAAWFTRARELRLLHILTTGDLRAGVLRGIALQELHPDNRDAFFTLEDAFGNRSAGWAERTERLRLQYEERRKRTAQDGTELPPLHQRPENESPLVVFALQLLQLVEAVRTAPELFLGVMVVLAPTQIDAAQEWEKALRGLVISKSLADARWVIVETGATTLPQLCEELGELGLSHECIADEAEVEPTGGEVQEEDRGTGGDDPVERRQRTVSPAAPR